MEKTKYRKAVKILYYIFGGFGFIAYFSYFVKQFIWFEGAFPFAVAALGCIVTGVPLFFRQKLEEILPGRIFCFLENLFAYGMLFYTVTFLALCSFVFSSYSVSRDVTELDGNTVFVVYGAGLRGDKPGAVLQKRLDRTAEYMGELPESVCVVTGGQGENEDVSEASAMKNYLLAKGISENRIHIEDKAHNTIENVKYTKKLLEKEGLTKRKTVSVSSGAHISRIRIICEKYGFDSEFVCAENPEFFSLFTMLVREYMSYVKLFLFAS